MLRLSHHYVSGRKLLFFAAEGLAICAVGFTGALGGGHLAALAAGRSGPWVPLRLATLAMGFALLLQFVMYLLDLYDLKLAREDRRRGHRVMRAAGFAAALLGVGLAAAPASGLPPGALLGAALGGTLGALAVRRAIRRVLGQPLRVLILGGGERAKEVARLISQEADGYRVCAIWEGPGDPEAIAQAASHAQAEVVVAAPDEARGTVHSEALLSCRAAGRHVYHPAAFFEQALRRIPVGYVRASDLAYADELTPGRARRIAKRALDVAIAAVLAALCAPLMALVALAVKLDSSGPVLYGQERVGQFGRPFRLLKFRSMCSDAEKDGAVWARPDDDRVTRVGRFIRKTRMDELPQVFNVLVGQMSFVGPRPERPFFVAELLNRVPFYAVRELVKPGITGWAQIRYPYGASVEDARNKLEYDLYYLKNGTLLLDLAIVFHTVRHVLLGKGAR